MLIADASGEPGPVDHFRLEHIPQVKKRDISPKVNHIMHCSPEVLQSHAEHQRGYKYASSWAEQNLDMQRGQERLFDDLCKKAKQRE